MSNGSFPEELTSSAGIVINPLQPTLGYGRLRHFHRLKREQFVHYAHAPLSVRWDEVDLSTLIDVLESCKSNNDQGEQKQADVELLKENFEEPTIEQISDLENNPISQSPVSQAPVGRFDPRAPHFDVVLINLMAHTLWSDPSIREPSLTGSKDIKSPDKVCEENTSESRGSSVSGPRDDTKAPRLCFARTDLDKLPMESLAGRPGWLFLWVGPSRNLVAGRELMGRWGFRKVESIGWMRTDGAWSPVRESCREFEEINGHPSFFRNAVEWCIVGLKGSAKRTFDSHLIHCNLDMDVMVTEGPEPPIASILSHMIENFSLGQRRLHLFAKPGDERPGWVTVGRDFAQTTFDCPKYMKTWGDTGRQGWLTPFDPEIEYFRPKTPPLQVRRRERGNIVRTLKPQKVTGENGKCEIELPRFPHYGQKKQPAWSLMSQDMRGHHTLYSQMDKSDTQFTCSVDHTNNVSPVLDRAPFFQQLEKPLVVPRVLQLSGLNRSYQKTIQQQNRRQLAAQIASSVLVPKPQPAISEGATEQPFVEEPLISHRALRQSHILKSFPDAQTPVQSETEESPAQPTPLGLSTHALGLLSLFKPLQEDQSQSQAPVASAPARRAPQPFLRHMQSLTMNHPPISRPNEPRRPSALRNSSAIDSTLYSPAQQSTLPETRPLSSLRHMVSATESLPRSASSVTSNNLFSNEPRKPTASRLFGPGFLSEEPPSNLPVSPQIACAQPGRQYTPRPTPPPQQSQKPTPTPSVTSRPRSNFLHPNSALGYQKINAHPDFNPHRQSVSFASSGQSQMPYTDSSRPSHSSLYSLPSSLGVSDTNRNSGLLPQRQSPSPPALQQPQPQQIPNIAIPPSITNGDRQFFPRTIARGFGYPPATSNRFKMQEDFVRDHNGNFIVPLNFRVEPLQPIAIQQHQAQVQSQLAMAQAMLTVSHSKINTIASSSSGGSAVASVSSDGGAKLDGASRC